MPTRIVPESKLSAQLIQRLFRQQPWHFVLRYRLKKFLKHHCFN